MEEYKNQFKVETNWEELRDRFFKQCCVKWLDNGSHIASEYVIKPEKLFDWFKNQFKEDSKEAGIEQGKDWWKEKPFVIQDEILGLLYRYSDSDDEGTWLPGDKFWDTAKLIQQEMLNSNNNPDIDLKK